MSHMAEEMCESVIHKWRALNLERAGDAGNELLDSEARFRAAASLSESSSEPDCNCMLHSNPRGGKQASQHLETPLIQRQLMSRGARGIEQTSEKWGFGVHLGYWSD
jgi:hypothetical protein